MEHQTGPLFRCLLLGALTTFVSCTTTTPHGPAGTGPAASPKMAKAEELFQKGDVSGAMIACVDLARVDPAMPGLEDLQRRIMKKLAEQRTERAERQAAESRDRMMTDVQARNTVPDTFNLRRNIKGETGSLRKAPSPLQKVLQKKVDASFDNINLGDFIRETGLAYGLNMVADTSVGQDKTINMNLKQVPLSEVLDYVSRNFGVAFYLGENVIWVTAQAQTQAGIPMETRMYRLRKGISPDSIPAQASSVAKAADQGGAAAENGLQPLNISEAIQRFVPQPEGADLMFDRKSHTMLVKNTADNLAKVEDIIEALDVCPPQVLIEARFINTRVTDLRELGVDWMINSDVQVTTSDGKNQTQINKGAALGFTPFPNVNQGLNLTYEGLLTDPMFKAVLHALETSGKAQTLSVPRVTTVNNRSAVIRIGKDFRYFDEYNVQTVPDQVNTTGNTTTYRSELVPVGEPKLEELGIELNVTPSVGADLQSVTLNLHPEISSLDGYETYEVGLGNNNNNNNNSNVSGTNSTGLVRLPIFRRSKIETQVIVQSGETVVMGGLISSTEQHDRSGIPWLLNLPFIGQLFRHDTITKQPDNLLIFVTATIISERGEDLIPLAAGPQALPAGATDVPK